MLIRKICCIGVGHIGGPLCAIIALKCPEILVTGVDKNAEKIMQWNSDSLPLHEPGLQEIVQKCLNKNLFFTSEMKTAIREADIIFVCVNMPLKTKGQTRGKVLDLSHLEEAANLIANVSETFKVVVEKSIVPVRAAETLELILKTKAKSGVEIQVISNPEFLTEGNAVKDLLEPERVLIGGEKSPKGAMAIEGLVSVYEHWVHRSKILTTDTWSSELAKLATNAFLAQRISSINSLSKLCEMTSADLGEVATAVGMDSRIGSKMLEPCISFGDMYYNRSIKCLVHLCESLNLNKVASYWQKVIDMNEYQMKRFAQNVIDVLYSTLTGKLIAIFGFSCKKNTNKTKDSAALYICKAFLEEGARLQIYDPAVKKHQILVDLNCAEVGDDSERTVTVVDDPYEAARGCRAIVLCTDWDEFKTVDFYKVYNNMMKPPYIFDGRKILPHKELVDMGFIVHSIGKNMYPNSVSSFQIPF